jgi:hypothetical protein
MPRNHRQSCWLLAIVMLALSACRPADAPKEPTKPNDDDPKVSAAAEHGGINVSFARRGQAIARL